MLIESWKEARGYSNIEFTADGDNAYELMYIDSVYFMTQTISTVGYGDFKGFVDTTGHW